MSSVDAQRPDHDGKTPERDHVLTLQGIREWIDAHETPKGDGCHEVAAIDPERGWQDGRIPKAFQEVWHALSLGRDVHPLSMKIAREHAVPLLMRYLETNENIHIAVRSVVAVAALVDRHRLVDYLASLDAKYPTGYPRHHFAYKEFGHIADGILNAVKVDEQVAHDVRSRNPEFWKKCLSRDIGMHRLLTLPHTALAEAAEYHGYNKFDFLDLVQKEDFNVRTVPVLTSMLPMMQSNGRQLFSITATGLAAKIAEISLACRTKRERDDLRALLKTAHDRKVWPEVEDAIVKMASAHLGARLRWEDAVGYLTNGASLHFINYIKEIMEGVRTAIDDPSCNIPYDFERRAQDALSQCTSLGINEMLRTESPSRYAEGRGLPPIGALYAYVGEGRLDDPVRLCKYIAATESPQDHALLEQLLVGALERPSASGEKMESLFVSFCAKFAASQSRSLMSIYDKAYQSNGLNAVRAITECLPALVASALRCGQTVQRVRDALRIILRRLPVASAPSAEALLALAKAGWELRVGEDGTVRHDPSAEGEPILHAAEIWETLLRLSQEKGDIIESADLGPTLRVLYAEHMLPETRTAPARTREEMKAQLRRMFSTGQKKWDILPDADPQDPDLQEALASMRQAIRAGLPGDPSDVVLAPETSSQGIKPNMPPDEVRARHQTMLSRLRSLFASSERKNRAFVRRLEEFPAVGVDKAHAITRGGIVALLGNGIIREADETDAALPDSVLEHMIDAMLASPERFEAKILPVADPAAIKKIAEKPLREWKLTQWKKKARKWLKWGIAASALGMGLGAIGKVIRHATDSSPASAVSPLGKEGSEGNNRNMRPPSLNPSKDALDNAPEKEGARTICTLSEPLEGVARYLVTEMDRSGSDERYDASTFCFHLDRFDQHPDQPEQSVCLSFPDLGNGDHIPMPFNGLGPRVTAVTRKGDRTETQELHIGVISYCFRYYLTSPQKIDRGSPEHWFDMRVSLREPAAADSNATVADYRAKIQQHHDPALQLIEFNKTKDYLLRTSLAARALRETAPDLWKEVESLRGKPAVFIAERLKQVIRESFLYAGVPSYVQAKEMEKAPGRDPFLEEVLKHRKAFCGPAADVYCELLRHAGVPCIKLGGYLAPRGEKIVTSAHGHAWAAVVLPARDGGLCLQVYDPTPEDKPPADVSEQPRTAHAPIDHPGVAQAYLLLLALLAAERATRGIRRRKPKPKVEAQAVVKPDAKEEKKKEEEAPPKREPVVRPAQRRQAVVKEDVPRGEQPPVPPPPPPEYEDPKPDEPLAITVDKTLIAAFDGAYRPVQNTMPSDAFVTQSGLGLLRYAGLQQAREGQGTIARALTDELLAFLPAADREYPAIIVAAWLTGALSNDAQLMQRIADMRTAAEADPRVSLMVQDLVAVAETAAIPDTLRAALLSLAGAGDAGKYRFKNNPEADVRAFLKLWEWQ